MSKYLIFLLLLFAVNSQENPPKKDDGRIWVEQEMEGTSTTTEKVPKPKATIEEQRKCVRKECWGNVAWENDNFGSKKCLIECPFPFEEGDGEEENKAWLLPIPFRQGIDPRKCGGQMDQQNEVLLEFEFCPRNEFGTPNMEQCKNSGYVICYESQLDPDRVGAKLDSIYSLANSNNTELVNLCNGQTPQREMGKSGGLAQALTKWENNKGMGLGPKHGFMVGKVASAYFLFAATFLPRNNGYTTTAKDICLRIRLYNEPGQFPTTKIALVDQNGTEILDYEKQIPENITQRLANGEPLNEGQLLGYWLLGLDMFARFRHKQSYNLKIVKRSHGKCVPKAVVRSTFFRDPANETIGPNGNGNGTMLKRRNGNWQMQKM